MIRNIFTKRIFIISFVLALSTALIQFTATHFSQRIYNMAMPFNANYAELSKEESSFGGIMMRSEVSDSIDTKMIEPSTQMMPFYNEDNALEVDNRLYSTTSFSQLVVKDVSSYVGSLRDYILSSDGRVLSSNVSASSRYSYGNISARVPSASVDKVLARVREGVVSVVREETNIQDETGTYVSVADQIVALQDQKITLEMQLVEAKDAVAKRRIELQIQRIDQQIAQLNSQQDATEERVTYARIDVSVSNSARYYDPSVRPTLWDMIQTAWNSLATVAYYIGYVMVFTAMYLVIWLPIVVFINFVRLVLSNKREE
ncbi:MAG: hypothetical protein COY80_01455 [Candidatus Pacebacteria bacterium CG_4_10_14_0_8_um_filter_42_14]|nr:MAG: hypothetical protein COY80_01455 [Candidatus Pacebacteria bacterium CG_4_10_14_0_8_um_filter_42_14]